MIRDRNLLAQLPHMYTLSVGLFVHTCISATGGECCKNVGQSIVVAECWR